jgi:hypothetical protein
MHRLPRSVSPICACVAVVLFWIQAIPAFAAPPAALAGSGVATVPADAAFFSSSLRMKEQLDRVLASNAYAKLKKLPALARALDSWEEQRDMPGSPVSMALTFLELPENAQAVELLTDMVASDTFVYGEQSCTDVLKLFRIVMAAQQAAAMYEDDLEMDADEEAIPEEEISKAKARLRVLAVSRQVEEAIEVEEDDVDDEEGDDEEVMELSGPDAQAFAVIEALAENVDLIKVPDIVWGFKTGKKEAAAFQLKRIEVLAKLLAEMNPEAANAMARKKVAGGEVLTFTLSGKLVPWDELVEEMQEEIGESEELDTVIEKVQGIDIVVALGIVGDWVVLSIGDSVDHLDKLVVADGKGKALIDTPAFAKLVEHADKPLTGIGYISEQLAAAMAPSKKDFEPLVAAVGVAMEGADASDAATEEVKAWAEGLTEEYAKRLPKLGSWLSFSFMTKSGYEGYTWAWLSDFPLDGGKPLSVLSHTGGNPVAVAVSRIKSDPTLMPMLRKAAGDGWKLLATYAAPEMDDDEREKFDQFSERFLPLADELGTIFTDKFLASLADGQVGFVMDAKSTTDKLHAELPSSAEALPLPEFAIVLPLADRKLFVDGLNDFFAWGDKVVASMREIEDNKIPEDYQIPEPGKKSVDGGVVWSFGVSDSGIDKQIAPAIGVGEGSAVFALVPSHAERLLAPAALKTGAALATFDGPLAAASALDVPALIDVIEPWAVYFTRYGCVMQDEGEVDSERRLSADDETPQAAEALSHVRVVLEVARCLKAAVTETTITDGALVTRWQNRIEDLPKP